MEPLFSKELTNSDVAKRLAVETRILGKLGIPREGGISRTLRVRDSHGVVWGMTLTTRPDGYLKPDFRGDWRAFVKAKELHAGDFLSFYQLGENEDDEAEYRIKVRRDMRLMGNDFTAIVA